jgi:hypothetical protein
MTPKITRPKITTKDHAMWYLHVAVPVLAAVAVNAVVYSLGWNRSSVGSGRPPSVSYKLLPPGYVIAGVWIVLLGLLGYVHYLARDVNATVAAWSVVALVAWCIGYPFYTGGLRSGVVASVANVATLAFAAAVTVAIAVGFPACGEFGRASARRRALLAISPLLGWATYVNIAQAVACRSRE